ncbi:MAG: hypothetical protein O6945_12075 [Gammaproteobacteria bacterium]|nr:hypothetical protein [Gammaproteobacteria bacterium]
MSDIQIISAFLKSYSDSSFTNPHEVVLPDSPPERAGDFTHMGARYWGFETKRHSTTQLDTAEQKFAYDDDAHHWLNIGLKQRAEIHRISISTKWFTGNHVHEVSVELIDRQLKETHLVLPRVTLEPDAEQEFSINPKVATDCLVKCYHEGGIARINLFGTPGKLLYDRHNLLADATISHTTNDHYGKPEDAVNGIRDVNHMVGWESARSGFGESTIFTLPQSAVIDTVIVDTYLHRLNSPLSCHVFTANLKPEELEHAIQSLPRWKLVFSDASEEIPDNFQHYMQERKFAQKHGHFDIKLHHPPGPYWQPLVPFAELHPDTWHEFDELESIGEVNVIYYMHYPNGGIHGLKMFGDYATPREPSEQ